MKKVFISTALFLTQLTFCSDNNSSLSDNERPLLEELIKVSPTEAYIECDRFSDKFEKIHPDYLALMMQQKIEEHAKKVNQIDGDLSAVRKDISKSRKIFPIGASFSSFVTLCGVSINELPLAVDAMGAGMSMIVLFALLGRSRVSLLEAKKSIILKKGQSELINLEESACQAGLLLGQSKKTLEISGAAQLLKATTKVVVDSAISLVEVMKKDD